ncbi:hypothetical protein [uncultured Pseudacidovorax sp.]|uniref:hypothetical protein n=1 Tax=uncultured Pseudacidovorax sp. TaxID=679313 RepID=UPI0025FD99F0|nr:hypothetical protein [uncultured Pseudacidovorax sp.]
MVDQHQRRPGALDATSTSRHLNRTMTSSPKRRISIRVMRMMVRPGLSAWVGGRVSSAVRMLQCRSLGSAGAGG